MKIFSKSMVILVRIQNQIIIYSIKLTCQESKSTYSYGFSVICFSNVLFKLYSLMFKKNKHKRRFKTFSCCIKLRRRRYIVFLSVILIMYLYFIIVTTMQRLISHKSYEIKRHILFVPINKRSISNLYHIYLHKMQALSTKVSK